MFVRQRWLLRGYLAMSDTKWQNGSGRNPRCFVGREPANVISLELENHPQLPKCVSSQDPSFNQPHEMSKNHRRTQDSGLFHPFPTSQSYTGTLFWMTASNSRIEAKSPSKSKTHLQASNCSKSFFASWLRFSPGTYTALEARHAKLQ